MGGVLAWESSMHKLSFAESGVSDAIQTSLLRFYYICSPELIWGSFFWWHITQNLSGHSQLSKFSKDSLSVSKIRCKLVSRPNSDSYSAYPHLFLL